MGYLQFTAGALFALAAACAGCIAIFFNWRAGVYLLFLWIPAEELVRKFAGNDMAFFLVKDILLAATYAAYFLAERRADPKRAFSSPAVVPLLLWFGWAVVQVFNPHSNGVFMGLVGLRMSFAYVPLIFLGFHMFRDDRELRRFCTALLALILIVDAVGLLQLILGPTFMNPSRFVRPTGADFLQARGTLAYGIFTYTNSVFASESRYGRFLLLSFALILGFTGFAQSQRLNRLRLLCVIALLATGVNLLMNGSRTLFVCLALIGVGFIVLRIRESASRALPSAFVLGAALVAAGSFTWFAHPRIARSVYGFYYATLSPDSADFEVARRLRQNVTNETGSVWGAIAASGLFGHGTGTASQGSQYVMTRGGPGARAEHINPVESGFGAFAWEHGVVGLGLVLWWMVALLADQLRAARELRHGRWLGLGAAIFLWSALFLGPITLWGIQGFQDFVVNSHLWFWSGVLLALPALREQTFVESRVWHAPSGS
ncbi:MAG: hypothetical protein HYY16_18560 [Planctomycetes bacterium]|nr:hypothetical protein [Planctomycetota bacterium]